LSAEHFLFFVFKYIFSDGMQGLSEAYKADLAGLFNSFKS